MAIINYKLLNQIVSILLLFANVVMVISQQQQLAAAPRVEPHAINVIVVNISDPVTLECRASGSPKPKITWFKDGQPLGTGNQHHQSSSSKYTLIHDSDLFIISATVGRGNKSDTGVYQCKATNEHGQAEGRNISLLIACKCFGLL